MRVFYCTYNYENILIYPREVTLEISHGGLQPRFSPHDQVHFISISYFDEGSRQARPGSLFLTEINKGHVKTKKKEKRKKKRATRGETKNPEVEKGHVFAYCVPSNCQHM
ncbi:unnamed protein product [Ascophyllum nodosum]